METHRKIVVPSSTTKDMLNTKYMHRYCLLLLNKSQRQLNQYHEEHADYNELWTIRTLANSAIVNSDPKKFGPSQFGPRPLVNSDLDHWSIRTFFCWSIRTSKKENLWSIRTFSIGQFGHFPLVNSDLFHWSIRTLSIGQFGPIPLVNSGLKMYLV